MQTCDNHLRWALRSKFTSHILQFLVSHLTILRIGNIEQDAGLRKVGCHQIRIGQQAAHLRTHLHIVGTVELAVIPHHGVNHHPGIGLLEAADKLLHNGNLLHRAQKACANTIKGQLVFLPAVHIGLHPRCIVVQIMVLKACVHRQDSRGQRAGLNLHCGNQGQLHRHGTAAKTGYIVYQGNAFLTSSQGISSQNLAFSGCPPYPWPPYRALQNGARPVLRTSYRAVHSWHRDQWKCPHAAGICPKLRYTWAPSASRGPS